VHGALGAEQWYPCFEAPSISVGKHRGVAWPPMSEDGDSAKHQLQSTYEKYSPGGISYTELLAVHWRRDVYHGAPGTCFKSDWNVRQQPSEDHHKRLKCAPLHAEPRRGYLWQLLRGTPSREFPSSHARCGGVTACGWCGSRSVGELVRGPEFGPASSYAAAHRYGNQTAAVMRDYPECNTSLFHQQWQHRDQDTDSIRHEVYNQSGGSVF